MLVSLRGLPEAQAEAITLGFFGELSHSEIATQLALSPGTVEGRMRLGLAKLGSQMSVPAPTLSALAVSPRTSGGAVPPPLLTVKTPPSRFAADHRHGDGRVLLGAELTLWSAPLEIPGPRGVGFRRSFPPTPPGGRRRRGDRCLRRPSSD
jgi:Sigma-70, region 4